MTKRAVLASFLPLAFASSPLLLAQAPVVGPRAAAMAGAATAVADDGTAVWTNPAGLARAERLDAEIFASALATNRNSFTAAVDRLSSLDLNAIRTGSDPAAVQRAIRDLNLLASPGTGVVGSGVAGAVFTRSGIAVAIGDLAFAGVYPTIDFVHIEPGNDPSKSLPYNQTALSFSGLEAREVRFSYARSFLTKVLLIGGTVRYISGRTYFAREGIFQINGTDPFALAREALKHNSRDTNKLSFDLGGMVNILGKARVGLVSTAINEPSFSVARDSADPTLIGAPRVVRLPRTLRAGAAAQPIGALTVAVDYDLRATNTLIPRGRSRQLAAGAEVKLPVFAIRAGAFRDSMAPDPHGAYSAGVGLGFGVLSVNGAVVFSSEGGTSLSSTNRRDVGVGLDVRVKL